MTVITSLKHLKNIRQSLFLKKVQFIRADCLTVLFHDHLHRGRVNKLSEVQVDGVLPNIKLCKNLFFYKYRHKHIFAVGWAALYYQNKTFEIIYALGSQRARTHTPHPNFYVRKKIIVKFCKTFLVTSTIDKSHL